MKVLSIKEPFATLIKEGIKKIETRSWKTNYRGELYIHASRGIVKKEFRDKLELMSLVNGELSYGNVICKCKLVDCIYMTEEFISNLKQSNYQEYLCGVYEEGRYAWVLDDVEIVEKFPVKGKLGIWNL